MISDYKSSQDAKANSLKGGERSKSRVGGGPPNISEVSSSAVGSGLKSYDGKVVLLS